MLAGPTTGKGGLTERVVARPLPAGSAKLSNVKGRKPKPTEVKIRQGNPGKEKLPQPVLIGGRMVKDEWGPPVKLPQYGKELWDEIVPYLAEVGLLDRVDRAALELLCLQWDRIVRARQRVNRDGVFSRGSTYQLIEHPGLKIEREATRSFMAIAEQFGLTPVARSRLGLSEVHRRSLQQELEHDLGKRKRVKLPAQAQTTEAEVVE